MKAEELEATAYWHVTLERMQVALHDLGTEEIASIRPDPESTTEHRVLVATPLGIVDFHRTIEQRGEPVELDRTLSFRLVPWDRIGPVELRGEVTKGFGQFNDQLGTTMTLELPDLELQRESNVGSDLAIVRSRSEILGFALEVLKRRTGPSR